MQGSSSCQTRCISSAKTAVTNVSRKHSEAKSAKDPVIWKSKGSRDKIIILNLRELNLRFMLNV